MIFKTKEFINSNKNTLLHFKYNGARNQIEEFDGIITETYNYIFIIKTNDGKTKSFSYNDVLINNLEIKKI